MDQHVVFLMLMQVCFFCLEFRQLCMMSERSGRPRSLFDSDVLFALCIRRTSLAQVESADEWIRSHVIGSQHAKSILCARWTQQRESQSSLIATETHHIWAKARPVPKKLFKNRSNVPCQVEFFLTFNTMNSLPEFVVIWCESALVALVQCVWWRTFE